MGSYGTLLRHGPVTLSHSVTVHCHFLPKGTQWKWGESQCRTLTDAPQPGGQGRGHSDVMLTLRAPDRMC